MSYAFYNLLHILGIVLVFMALGGYAFHGANGGTKEDNKARGLLAGTHGVGMLLILVAGFGMLAKIDAMASIPAWVYPKLLIWVVLGAAPALLNRKPEQGKVLWFVLFLLGGTAAYLGINHFGDASSSAPAAETETETEASDED